ncbi:MAG TPA: nucleoside hydrolase [Bacteroidetes bacterium]|nr:nucleoside hydrolase [Bacteroidota bacterium]
MIRYFLFLSLLVLMAPVARTQDISVPLPVIVDTDGAPDDMRALCMLLSLQEVELLGVVASDGAVDPLTGYEKARQLFASAGTPHIPLATGRKHIADPPPWREFCTSVPWADGLAEGKEKPEAAVPLMNRWLNRGKERVILICLGSLTSVSDLLAAYPESRDKIRKIVWYNEGLEYRPLTNYALDREAAERVLSSGITLDVIGVTDRPEMKWTEEMIATVEDTETLAAKLIAAMFRSKAFTAGRHGKEAGVMIWDELIPVYLIYPELFDMEPDLERPNLAVSKDYFPAGISDRILQILSGQYSLENNIVFDVFPVDPGLYAYDVRERMQEILEKHGREEWKLGVLTNEIHGHLGIYSIVGAKMGLKARELLGAAVDDAEVLSYAGSLPPLSCLNDGLQVSTGATVGMGTIRVVEGEGLAARAVVTAGGKSVDMRLKPEYERQVEDDISRGILLYGNLTEGYWKLIRELALKYWADWDRDEMFEVVEKGK